MEKKLSKWKPKGMNRDLSVSAFNPEFTYENRNIRLCTNENNTLLSMVNERGTAPISITITKQSWNADPYEEEFDNWPYPDNVVHYMLGTPIGTAVLNDQLVVFTHQDNNDVIYDCIYVLEYSNAEKTTMAGKMLYCGNLNFQISNPLETLVAYESEYIQKVYWTDGLNQPRMINIAATTEKLTKWNSSEGTALDTFFDFVPAIKLDEDVTIVKNTTTNGLFAPGVIQYCLTYINKYGQQSNIFYVSPLYYLAYNDRGASPEEKVSCSFNIKVSSPDYNFDYVRIYSIQRTSIDATPFVKLVDEVKLIPGSEEYRVEWELVPQNTYNLPYRYSDSESPRVKTTTISNVESYETTIVGELDGFLYSSELYFIAFSGTDPQYRPWDSDYYVNANRLDSDFDTILSIAWQQAGSDEDYFVKESYAGFKITPNIISILEQEAAEIFPGETHYIIFVAESSNDPNYYYVHEQLSILNGRYAIYDYATQRWSICTSLPEVSIEKIKPVNITDNGLIGSSVDPTELLFIGGKEITALTMVDKDNILFLGNLVQKNTLVNDFQDYFNSIRGTSANAVISFNFDTSGDTKRLWQSYTSGYYGYDNQLDKTQREITTFKGGETYRFGFQLQKNTGEWTEPIFIDDVRNDKYPKTQLYNQNIYLSYATAKLNIAQMIEAISGMTLEKFYATYQRIKPVVVYPTIGERSVLCQGVINATVFNAEDRISNTPYAQASWFFRPYMSRVSMAPSTAGAPVEFVHYAPIPSCERSSNPGRAPERIVVNTKYTHPSGDRSPGEDFRQLEVETSSICFNSAWDTSVDKNPECNSQFFIDQSIVTLNSPDIEFDTDVQTFGMENLKLRLVGVIPITASVSSHTLSSGSMMGLNTGQGSIRFGIGNIGGRDVRRYNISQYAGNRLIAEYLWNDCIEYLNGDEVKALNRDYNYLVYPWHRYGPMNNDGRALSGNSIVAEKKMANNLYSYNTEYFSNNEEFNPSGFPPDFENIDAQMVLSKDAPLINKRLNAQMDNQKAMNYYPNIDKNLYNNRGNVHVIEPYYEGSELRYWPTVQGSDILPEYHNNQVPMRYKSTDHAVIALQNVEGYIPTMPFPYYNSSEYPSGEMPHIEGQDPDPDTHEFPPLNTGDATQYPISGWSLAGDTFWGEYKRFAQGNISMKGFFKDMGDLGNHEHSFNTLWLGELYRDVPNKFGGTSINALKENKWVDGGAPINLSDAVDDEINLIWTDGDTYYQRYDCMKTFRWDDTGPNGMVEILSFMCETHVNIAGRYDKNRGLLENQYLSPQIFNQINPVYSQRNNFFTARKVNVDDIDSLSYPNHLFYTKTKESGADVDLWTNVTLASTLELDGDKGAVKDLERFNNELIAFQDSGISHILYNEQVQISTSQGVPIEIANSGKVQGKRYVSDTIGCSNKWSIVNTPQGIYFTDSNDKNIYLYNGKLSNVSLTGGFNTWTKQNIPSTEVSWTPNFADNAIVSYYDRLNNDVLFINDEEALAFSERLGAFTSFYDYGYTPYFCNLQDTGVWVRNDGSLWKHNAGNYCRFFGENKPYSMTFIGNQEPERDKTFTNLEFRASVDGDGELNRETGKFTPTLPFDSLETWNEHQHGYTTLENRSGHNMMVHGTNRSALNRKFRIWRCDIPRNNCLLDTLPRPATPYSLDSRLGISRYIRKPNDRMRNPWIYLKLLKNAAVDDTSTTPTTEHSLNRAEIHDIMMTYFE